MPNSQTCKKSTMKVQLWPPTESVTALSESTQKQLVNLLYKGGPILMVQVFVVYELHATSPCQLYILVHLVVEKYV